VLPYHPAVHCGSGLYLPAVAPMGVLGVTVNPAPAFGPGAADSGLATPGSEDPEVGPSSSASVTLGIPAPGAAGTCAAAEAIGPPTKAVMLPALTGKGAALAFGGGMSTASIMLMKLCTSS